MGAGWCDETVRQINVPLIGMRKVFEALGVAHDEEVVEEGDDVMAEKEVVTAEKPVGGVLGEPIKAASRLWSGRFWRTQVS